MNAYQLMIVDDEEDARESIVTCIDWEKIGFRVVATADNGEDALEQIESVTPEAVMTDIQMPFMDGLTFIKRLKEKLPDTKVVIFSGYDDFEYAQEAIRLEAEEYILKPIDAEQLTEVFRRVRERLDEDYDRRHNIQRLEQYYRESLSAFKEQLLIGLLEGRLQEEEMKRFSKDYGLSVDSAFYVVGVLHFVEDVGEEGALDSNMRSVSLRQLAEEIIGDSMEILSVNYIGQVVIIGCLKQTSELGAFIRMLDQICKLSGNQYGSDTVAGIGKVYGDPKGIHSSFKEAKEATLYRILLSADQAIYIGDVEPKTEEPVLPSDERIAKLVREIKLGNSDSIRKTIDTMIEQLKNSFASISALKLNYMQIIMEISRLANAYQVALSWASPASIYEEVEQVQSIEAIGNRLFSVCVDLMHSIRQNRQDNTKLLGEKAKSYIHEHFAQSSLSVDMVCNHLGVGATYFSTIFKMETGMTFIAYLTKIRMEEAIRLMNNTDEKSYVIAGMVGYEEPSYFSYVFKKHYGMSPSKYRQREKQ